MENTHAEPANCINCGDSKFEWGWVHMRGTNSGLLYSHMNEGWIVGMTGRQLKSRRCLSCNHLTFSCNTHRSPSIRFSLRALLIVTTLVAILAFLITLAARGIR